MSCAKFFIIDRNYRISISKSHYNSSVFLHYSSEFHLFNFIIRVKQIALHVTLSMNDENKKNR